MTLNKFISARFLPAGHILGSSFIEVRISEPNIPPIKVVFSGDLGRYDEPILNDPAQESDADYLLVESTYGNRLHDHTDPKDRLAEIITRHGGSGRPHHHSRFCCRTHSVAGLLYPRTRG